jgi:hypothetical protein
LLILPVSEESGELNFKGYKISKAFKNESLAININDKTAGARQIIKCRLKHTNYADLLN